MIKQGGTGCSLNIVFFSQICKYIPDSGLSWFFFDVYTELHDWTTKWQVEHQRCSWTGRVKKIYDILRKNHNINERPVFENQISIDSVFHIWKKMCKTILLDLIENNDCVQQETDIICP